MTSTPPPTTILQPLQLSIYSHSTASSLPPSTTAPYATVLQPHLYPSPPPSNLYSCPYSPSYSLTSSVLYPPPHHHAPTSTVILPPTASTQPIQLLNLDWVMHANTLPSARVRKTRGLTFLTEFHLQNIDFKTYF